MNLGNGNNQDQNEKELETNDEFEIPQKTKILLSILPGLLVISIVGIYCYLLFCDPEYIEPSKFGLPEILLLSIALLTIINIPWTKLGVRIKRIGILELEKVVKTQANGNSQEFADLQEQIDILKKKISPSSPSVADIENTLDEAILDFLRKYSNIAFSPLRIKNRGANENIDIFKSASTTTAKIRESLRRLLSQGKILSKVSKRGNTIFKIK